LRKRIASSTFLPARQKPGRIPRFGEFDLRFWGVPQNFRNATSHFFTFRRPAKIPEPGTQDVWAEYRIIHKAIVILVPMVIDPTNCRIWQTWAFSFVEILGTHLGNSQIVETPPAIFSRSGC